MKNQLEKILAKNNISYNDFTKSIISKYVSSEYITKVQKCKYYLVYFRCSYVQGSFKAVVFRIEPNRSDFTVLKDTLTIISSRYEAEVFKADFKNKLKASVRGSILQTP